jgi:hypothetical protein
VVRSLTAARQSVFVARGPDMVFSEPCQASAIEDALSLSADE